MSMDAPHQSDGTDDRGDGLEIVIRIAPDGRVLVHDITAAMLPVLAALDPTNAEMAVRAAAALALDNSETAREVA